MKEKRKVVVASTNPVKTEVARRAFGLVFPDEDFEFIQVQSESGVSDQPFDHETRIGAHNRLEFVKTHSPNAHFWIAQEGGIERDGKTLTNRAWIAVADSDGSFADASTPTFRIPTEMARTILEEGLEHGAAADKFFSTQNIKHSKGSVGLLTDGLIDRAEYYLQAAVIALSQLKRKEWYA